MKQLTLFLSILFFTTPLAADEYMIPNTFEANTPARAEEVNANFEAGKAAVDDNHNRIATLEDQLQNSLTRVAQLEALVETLNDLVDSLQTQLAAVQDNSVLALNDTLTLDDTGNVPVVRLSGVNLQLVNGQGDTESVNGAGNLIVGYNEAPPGLTAEGRAGSHNLVVGSHNRYESYAGIVAGKDNEISGDYATVTGGQFNIASGNFSHVSGGGGFILGVGDQPLGLTNVASGAYAAILGGNQNEASGDHAAISGGSQNEAGGRETSISGGQENIASGVASSVSGGRLNEADGFYTAISGGEQNSTGGAATASSVYGGQLQTADEDYSVAP
ncbi:MAG: hypothetical protein P8010_22900 [Desulfosarcinaceae bacterium]|jgi:hypothetical protein